MRQTMQQFYIRKSISTFVITNIKAYIAFLLLILWTLPAQAIDYYWVGGTGNWSDISHWVTTTGGTVQHTTPPTANDDVFFDANSFDGPNQVVTVNTVSVLCQNLSWTGVTNNPTLDGTGDKSIQIFGELRLSPNMVMDFQGKFVFNGSIAGLNIDFTGHAIQNLNFQSPDGSWVINSPITVIKTLNIDGGNIDFNGQSLKAYNLNIRPTQACVVDLADCNIVLGYVPPMASAPNSVANLQILSTFLDLFTTNSVIEMPGQKAEMHITGDKDVRFNVVNVLDPIGAFVLNDPGFINTPGVARFSELTLFGNGRIFGSNSFTDLTLSPRHNYIFGLAYTQTIGSLHAVGRCDAPIDISSNLSGNPAIFSFSTDQSVTYTNIKDIHANGAGQYDVISGADEGGNSGWIFDGTGAVDLYWVGGNGNWDDPNHWATVSGGVGGSCLPNARTNVIFDQNSFTAVGQAVNVNVVEPECLSMIWTDATMSPQFTSTSASTLHIFGSLDFIPAMSNLFSR